MKRFLACLAVWLLPLHAALAEGMVIVAHPSVPRMDQATVQRVYTGRVIEIGGVSVVPLNAPPGHPDRKRFLRDYLQQDDEKYIGYWTVRRYIGKGTPPREVNSGEMASTIQTTPGAIGYLPESELRPGMNVILRRPTEEAHR